MSALRVRPAGAQSGASQPPSRLRLSASDDRRKNKNGAARAPFSQKHSAILLDLGFTEFDVLARDRVVLLLDELVGHGARILLGDVIEAGIRGGNELDLDGDRFGHGGSLKYWEIWRRPTGPHLARNLAANRHKSRFSGPNSLWIPGIYPSNQGFPGPAGQQCRQLPVPRADPLLANQFSKKRFFGRGRPRVSRNVLPSYSLRKRPRRCNSATTLSTKSFSPAGRYGNMILKPSLP